MNINEQEQQVGIGEPLFEMPDDPIVAELIKFREDVEFDLVPDEPEQVMLVDSVRRAQALDETHRKTARYNLLSRNSGRVAALVYPYRAPDTESKDLLRTGGIALLRAALTYDASTHGSFTDYSVGFIRDVLNAQFPTKLAPADQESPEEWIVKLIPDAYNPRIPEQGANLPDLPEDVNTILPLLHLPLEEIRGETGLSHRRLFRAIRQAKEMLEVSRTVDVALKALSLGLQFKDLRAPSPTATFTQREVAIASQLEKPNAEIGEAVSLQDSQLRKDIHSLSDKMNARTRVEAVLIARTHTLPLTEEDLLTPALKEFNPREREVIERLCLYPRDIAKQISTSPESIVNTMKRMREKTGTTDNVQLALELLKRGVVFDVPRPKQPLEQLFDEDKLAVIGMLGPPRPALAKALGLSRSQVHRLVWGMLSTAGARSEVELALMAKLYPPGGHSTNELSPDEQPKAA